MPYSVREEHGRYCVYKRESKLKCYNTKHEAEAYFRALEMATHGKAAQAILTVLKYGRVLSSANETEIRSAVNALISVLQRAGIDLTGNPMDEKELSEAMKQVDPETAQQIVEVVNAFVQDLDAKLGITEAVQQTEQPPAENENPDEAAQENTTDETPQEDQPEEDGQQPPKKKPPERKDAEKMVMRPTQAETNYTPDSAGSEHCASCRWFHQMEGAPGCHLIENYPLDIQPTGYCDRYEALPMMDAEPAPIPVEIVQTGEMAVSAAVTTAESGRQPKPTKTTLVQVVKNLFTRPVEGAPSFQVFKGSDGKYYWLARHTNMFEDRDKEILSSEAHKRYIARVDLGLVDKPELWMWHAKGTRHGQADYVWEHAGFVFALGHFDDMPEGKRAVKFYQRHQGQIELSHGFTYPSWALKDGVYHTYNTFEISTLPPGAAANPYTRFEEIAIMALSDKQRQFITDGLGQDVLERIERAQAAAEKDAQTLIAEDKRYKDFADAIPEKDGEIAVDLKKVLKVVSDLIAAQGNLEAAVTAATAEATAQKAAREASEKTVTDLRKEVTELREQLKLRPRMASRAKETDIEGKNVLEEALKKVNEDEYEDRPGWGKVRVRRE